MRVTAAKTPGVAIARVLRNLGLKQGHDFSVRGHYVAGERRGTDVFLHGGHARQTVISFADEIEDLVSEAGFAFNVSIRNLRDGAWPTLANYGDRIRDAVAAVVTEPTAFVMDADPATVPQAVTTQQDPHGAAIHAAAAAWTKGTRVSFVNSKGVTVHATVTGKDIGVVTKCGHDNYGRVYLGVGQDPTKSIPWRQPARVFADELTAL